MHHNNEPRACNMINVHNLEAPFYMIGWIAMSECSDARFVSIRNAPIDVHLFFEESVRSQGIPISNLPDQTLLMVESDCIAKIVRDFIGQDHSQLPKCCHDHTWEYIRGCFDATGYIDPLHMECYLTPPPKILEQLASFVSIPHQLDSDKGMMLFAGANCIDFLGKLYNGQTDRRTRSDVHFHQFLQCLIGKHPQQVWGTVMDFPVVKLTRTDSNAILPSKCNTSDVGYDLTIIHKIKDIGPNVTLYDTCIQICPPIGYYAEIIARSSLSKTGYMIANGTGIIDPGYTGNILVALARISPDATPIKLPFRCCQIIFRQQVHVELREDCASHGNMVSSTTRGGGGFGSTNPLK